MIILGIGSNLGDRLSHLRQALKFINELAQTQIMQVSPLYFSDALLPPNAPSSWHKPYINAAVLIKTQFEPLDLLAALKKIESLMGRKIDSERFSPRIIDIDILTFNDRHLNLPALKIPHQELCARPFALWPLLDIAPLWKPPLNYLTHKPIDATLDDFGSRHLGLAPYHTQQIAQRIDCPKLVGIINVTPDSFSDGGKYLSAEKAFSQAQKLVAGGAEVLDIGAESTAPNATLLDGTKEWERLLPVLTTLKEALPQFNLPPKISIDTRKAEIAEQCLKWHADCIINDVSGLEDPKMRDLIADSKAECILMHHVSIPANRKKVLSTNFDPLMFVYDFAERKLAELEQANISRDKIIFDVGIGFGKSAAQSLMLIKHIEHFKTLKTRLLVGHSRKSFLSLFTSEPPHLRDIETLVGSLYLAPHKVDYLRVHDVEGTARAFKVMQSLGLSYRG